MIAGLRIAKRLYIFDLDGTLALIGHRRHYVERGRHDWKSFYAACVDDEPNWPVIGVMESLRAFADVWIFSGRSDEVRQQTVEWLVRYTSFATSDFDSAFGTQDVLTMRREGDYTPDYALKKDWLDCMLVDDRQRLAGVFDDRDTVVAMWRRNGVQCFQVAPGDF